jgi:hypothetical protein
MDLKYFWKQDMYFFLNLILNVRNKKNHNFENLQTIENLKRSNAFRNVKTYETVLTKLKILFNFDSSKFNHNFENQLVIENLKKI